MRRATAAVLLAVLLCGCGGETDDSDSAAAPSPEPSASADPKGEWLGSVASLCRELSGAVRGAQVKARLDNKITPDEVLKADKAAQPALAAFDKGLAALPAPPEAAASERALEDFLARSEPIMVEVLEAARNGDQKRLNAALAAREKLRLSPQGYKALYTAGLPEICTIRGEHSAPTGA